MSEANLRTSNVLESFLIKTEQPAQQLFLRHLEQIAGLRSPPPTNGMMEKNFFLNLNLSGVDAKNKIFVLLNDLNMI